MRYNLPGVLRIGGRIIEAYVGEYASGKSENAVNRAIDLLESGRKVRLVDLDLVEPFYTLRPIRKELIAKGLEVIAWETNETMGLGEAGSILKPEMRWALNSDGDIILDIGYGVEGAKTLNIIEGARENKDLRIFAVINIARPITSSFEDIIEYVKELGIVHGLINNSHLGDDTDIDIIQEGARIITKVSQHLGIPVIATSVEQRFSDIIGDTDCEGNNVRVLKRYMPKTFW